jgi:hypothetical protein
VTAHRLDDVVDGRDHDVRSLLRDHVPGVVSDPDLPGGGEGREARLVALPVGLVLLLIF